MKKDAKQCVLQERAEGVALNGENDNDGRPRSSASFKVERPGSREEDDRNKSPGACSYVPVSSGSGLGQRLLKRMPTKASGKLGTYSNVISQNIFSYTRKPSYVKYVCNIQFIPPVTPFHFIQQKYLRIYEYVINRDSIKTGANMRI